MNNIKISRAMIENKIKTYPSWLENWLTYLWCFIHHWLAGDSSIHWVCLHHRMMQRLFLCSGSHLLSIFAYIILVYGNYCIMMNYGEILWPLMYNWKVDIRWLFPVAGGTVVLFGSHKPPFSDVKYCSATFLPNVASLIRHLYMVV